MLPSVIKDAATEAGLQEQHFINPTLKNTGITLELKTIMSQSQQF